MPRQTQFANAARARLFPAVILVSFCAVPAGAHAAIITYTETATIAGSLNGVPFFGNELLLTGSADTIHIAHGGCCYFTTLNIEFAVDGIGSGMFTYSGRLALNETNGSIGFGDIFSNHAILYLSNPAALAGYDLAGPFGPIVGTAVFNPGFAFTTTAGPLIINSSGDPTFMAVEVVPVPAALWLFGGALGVLGALRTLRELMLRPAARAD